MTTQSPLRITGIGAISSAGNTADDLWKAMCHDRPRPTPVDDNDLITPVREMFLASETPVLEHSAAEFGIQAAHEAVNQAERGGFNKGASRMAVVVGTGMGEATRKDACRSKGDPSMGESIFTTALQIASEVEATGPVVSISNACAAGAYAIGHAADMLWADEADAVLVVGAEAYSRVAIACFNRMNALDKQGCRPFSINRSGTLFGEGAGSVVLERSDSDTTPVGWLLSSAFSCDAGHLTAPAEYALQMRRTFDEAIRTSKAGGISAVVPHGTGTRLNDAVEAVLLANRTPNAAWFSLKPLLGHTGGASAVLSVVAACLMAAHREVPGNPDVGNLIAEATTGIASYVRAIDGPIAVNAYAFGGNNATLIIEGNQPWHTSAL